MAVGASWTRDLPRLETQGFTGVIGASKRGSGSLGRYFDGASLRGGWYAFLAILWLCSHLATGVLPLCGIVSATLGIGKPRFAGAVWSAVALAIFFLSLFVSVNSFH